MKSPPRVSSRNNENVSMLAGKNTSNGIRLSLGTTISPRRNKDSVSRSERAADGKIIERVTHLNSLPRGSLSGDVGPPRPLPAPSLREDARALDMYAAGAGGGLQGGQQTGLLPPGVERV